MGTGWHGIVFALAVLFLLVLVSVGTALWRQRHGRKPRGVILDAQSAANFVHLVQEQRERNKRGLFD